MTFVTHGGLTTVERREGTLPEVMPGRRDLWHVRLLTLSCMIRT